MRIRKFNLRSSLLSLLGPADTPTAAPAQVDHVRQAMSEALGPDGQARFVVLATRIRCARDVMALWHLRADLMAALAALRGEAAARAQLAKVTAAFDGLLPPGLLPRRPGA